MTVTVSKSNRVLVAVAAGLLLLLYVTPLWRISLAAPQYPEGLGMKIGLTTVTGVAEHDLQNINSLNHYIGMKPIDPAGIGVLRVMPWVVGGLVVFGLAVAAIGRRGLLYTWMAAFVALGAAGMVVFWWWQYDYGHNLDMENAIIKIPGMSYQPPLIGVKQLLNFRATSLPDIGGWLVGLAFVLGAIAVFRTARYGAREPVAG